MDKVYDSMAAAATGEGISLELLKRAKKLACPNFHGSRVHAKGLKKWITEHQLELDAMGEGSLKDQKTSLEIRKLTRIEETADRLLIRKSEVAGAIRRILAKVSVVAEARLVNEYPSVVAGLDVAQARVYGRRLHDDLMGEYQKLAKEFPE